MILIGNALDELKKMESDSVDCVVTSPPYWSLRKYDIPDVIFDGVEGCGHEWTADPIPGEKSGKPGPNATVGARFESAEMKKYKRFEQFKLHRFTDGTCMYRIGKKKAGRRVDGQEWNEFPK